MFGMSRDKLGAATVAGFFKVYRYSPYNFPWWSYSETKKAPTGV
jgi:hypothetical protein